MSSTLQLTVAVLSAVGIVGLDASAAEPTTPVSSYSLDLTGTGPAVRRRPFSLGTAGNPDGHTIEADNLSLLRDGKPWLAVMGEIHYARVTRNAWRNELLKMKAGGIDVVASYVFWIHHEEVRGEWDWSGERSLREFVQACGEVGMPVVVRTGPWCHGEVRNGGFPDWLQKDSSKTRTDDPAYLQHVRSLYNQIGEQLKGLLWKDGGPVVGIQLENEFGGHGAHLMTLKRLAREAGMDVPLYTRTGWPNLASPIPFGEILPLFGAYAEGFWDRSITPMPGKYWHAFTFEPTRTDAAIGSDQLGVREARDEADAARYPYLTCELGGGMMSSYHRRIKIDPRDIAAVLLSKVGSGSNLPGYYMYHGGTNPIGKRTTLQESQATNYWNDLPVMSYDFQAPLGEFGQVRPHYHLLRRTHLFLNDYGPELSGMAAVFPEARPKSKSDTATLRWSARTDGDSGFVFVNNYQRLQPMPAKPGARFELKLKSGTLHIPSASTVVPADASFFWPFNLDLAGTKLVYATAQPVCRLVDGDTTYAVFAATGGVRPEFAFAADGIRIESAAGERSDSDGRILLTDLKTGLDPAIQILTGDGKRLSVILLDDEASLSLWKGSLAGRARLFFTQANMIVDGNAVSLSSSEPDALAVSMLPAPGRLRNASESLAGTPNGVFVRFDAANPRTPAPRAARIEATARLIRNAGPARTIRQGSKKVAEAPSDSDFAGASAWDIELPQELADFENLRLRVRYVGDVARVYLDDRLLTDDFYAGNAFEVGLGILAGGNAPAGRLRLEVLPLQKDAPIYFSHPPDGAPASGPTCELLTVEVVRDFSARFEIID